MNALGYIFSVILVTVSLLALAGKLEANCVQDSWLVKNHCKIVFYGR